MKNFIHSVLYTKNFYLSYSFCYLANTIYISVFQTMQCVSPAGQVVQESCGGRGGVVEICMLGF